MKAEKWVRPDLPPMPKRIAKLPVDHRGYPVPWFVQWVDGKPDFRVIGIGKRADAYHKRLCWVCGEPLGKFMAFVIGPMCAVNRISSEPPSHRDCAEFSARACPFLTRPQVERREGNLPEGANLADTPGIALARNPGVALVWVTKRYTPFQAPNGTLFNVGAPEEVLWFAQGRKATSEEVFESIRSGIPLLEEYARQDGPEAMADFNNKLRVALNLADATTR